MARPPRLDRIDLNILTELQRDSGRTNVALADAVGLSASPCLQRVRRLERAGYIDGYTARLNTALLADTVTVFTEVTLNDHRREDFTRFEAAIGGYATVRECQLISGGHDYLLKFVTRGLAHYQAVIEGMLGDELGIDKYFSYVVIKTVLARGAVPLRELLPMNEDG